MSSFLSTPSTVTSISSGQIWPRGI